MRYVKQTGNEEVDTLDVLCFGRETMEEICDNLLIRGFGTQNTGITVVDPPEDPTAPTKVFIPTKKYPLYFLNEQFAAITEYTGPLAYREVHIFR